MKIDVPSTKPSTSNQHNILKLSREQLSKNSIFTRRDRNPWLDFVDVVGNLSTWPKFIRAAFWSGANFNDHQRMLVVNFAILNGVHLDVLLNTLDFTIGKHIHRRNRRYQVCLNVRIF